MGKVGRVETWVSGPARRNQSFANFTAMKLVRQFQRDNMDSPRESMQRRLTVMDHIVYTGWYVTGMDCCLVVFADPQAEEGRQHRIDIRIEKVNDSDELGPVFMVKGWGAAIMVATDIAHQLQQIPTGTAEKCGYPRGEAGLVVAAVAWCYMNMEQRLISNMRWGYWAHPQRQDWLVSEIDIDAGGYRQRSNYPKILDVERIRKDLPNERRPDPWAK